jgi:hypothetical protein
VQCIIREADGVKKEERVVVMDIVSNPLARGFCYNG